MIPPKQGNSQGSSTWGVQQLGKAYAGAASTKPDPLKKRSGHRSSAQPRPGASSLVWQEKQQVSVLPPSPKGGCASATGAGAGAAHLPTPLFPESPPTCSRISRSRSPSPCAGCRFSAASRAAVTLGQALAYSPPSAEWLTFRALNPTGYTNSSNSAPLVFKAQHAGDLFALCGLRGAFSSVTTAPRFEHLPTVVSTLHNLSDAASLHSVLESVLPVFSSLPGLQTKT